MRARKVNEDIVQKWEEKHDELTKPWFETERWNHLPGTDAFDYLEEEGIEPDENGDLDISTSRVASWAVSNWERFWDDRQEMFAEQEFPGGIEELVSDLEIDMGDFEQSYDPGEMDEEYCDNCGEEIDGDNELTGDGYCTACSEDEEDEEDY